MSQNNKKDYILDVYLKLDDKLERNEIRPAIRRLKDNNEDMTRELKTNNPKVHQAWKRKIAANKVRIEFLNKKLRLIEEEIAKKEQSEYEEWRENDDARRYRETESDNNRPY